MAVSTVLALLTALQQWRERAPTVPRLPNAWTHYWVDIVCDSILGLSFFLITIVQGAKNMKDMDINTDDAADTTVAKMFKSIVGFEALLLVLLTAAAGLCFWIRRSMVVAVAAAAERRRSVELGCQQA
jgi:hypothetical protein